MGGRAKAAAAEARKMGAVDFSEAMEMVKDNERAQEFFTKLEALKVEIGAEIDKSLTVEAIDRLLIQTRDDRNMAREELEAARTEAAEVKRQAEAALAEAAAQFRNTSVLAREVKALNDRERSESRKRIADDEHVAKAALSGARTELAAAKHANATAETAQAFILEKKERVVAALQAINA